MIRKKEMIKPIKKLDSVYSETEELVAIIAKVFRLQKGIIRPS
jgi:hypothetical protein